MSRRHLFLPRLFTFQALGQHQMLLQKYVVPVPHHLEHVDMYRHTGKLPDSSFRKPWKRAPVDKKMLQNEGTRLLAELICLSELVSKQIKEIESLGRDMFDSFEHGVFDLGEFIPSSNPSSQEDIPETLQLDLNNPLQTKEIFLKENIQHQMFAFSSDSFKLEEVFMSDPLPDLSRNVPSLNAMCGRLHPNQVTDPLNSRDSGLLALKDRITQKEVLSQEDCGNVKRCEVSSEKWQKFDLTGADGELEECLFPFEKEKSKKEAITKSTKIATELGTSRPLEVKSPASAEGQASSPMQTDKDTFERLVKREVDNKYKTGVEKVAVIDLQVKFTPSFLEINEIYSDSDDVDIKKALLDSPIVGSCVEPLSLIFCDLKQSLAQLPPQSLLENCNIRLITPAQKENITGKIWQHEKYLDDIISMRLPDIEGKSKFDIDISPNKVKDMLKLKADKNLGKVELSLSWDAVSVTATKVKECTLERLKEEDSYKQNFTTVSPVEQFKKYTSTALSDDKDPVLEVLSHISSGDMIETKQNTEKAEVWKPSFQSRTHPHPVQLSKAGGDPLNDFLLLRSIHSVSMERQDTSKSWDSIRTQETKGQSVPVAIIKTAHTSPQMSPSDLDIHSIGVIQPQKRQKTWDYRTIHVAIQGEFASVLKIIENQASFYMAALRGVEDMHLSDNFSDLMPENTRFLVKQKEKSLEDEKEDGTKCDVYKAIVALHILCGARDILIHCCFEPALAHIKSMQEKYQLVLKNCFDDMRRKLFQCKCNFDQRRIFHPKLVSLYQHIDKRLKNSTKDKNGTKEKILIVIGQERTSLKYCLRDFMQGGSGMRTYLLTDLSGELSQRLESVTCLVAHRNELVDEFPWSLFTVVMDYNDCGGNASLEDQCKMYGLLLISFSVKHNLHTGGSNQTGLTSEESMAPQNKQTCAPLTIIGSRYLTSRPELLQLLETRHNLMILERDYDQIKSIDEMYFADLVIDERTCIVVQSVKDMAETWQYEIFNSKIITLSLKFTTCCILFYSNDKSQKHRSCIENIARFQAAIGNLARKQDFIIKTFISNNATEAAKFVRQVCDISEKSSPAWKDGSWRVRTWIAEECSEEEKTLLSFPCFNSFSAQLVLQEMPLGELLSTSYSELVTLFPWMPQKFLKSFLEMVHQERSSNLLSKESHHGSTGLSELTEDSTLTLEDYKTKQNPESLQQQKLSMDSTLGSESVVMEKPYQYNWFTDSGQQLDSDIANSTALTSQNFPGEALDEASSGMDNQQQVSLQVSEDLWSLSGSQSSVKLNEFERAEIEGRNMTPHVNLEDSWDTCTKKENDLSERGENIALYRNSQQNTGITWNTKEEIEEDRIRGKNIATYRIPQEVWTSQNEIQHNIRQSCSKLSAQGFPQHDIDQKNINLTATGLKDTFGEDAFEQAVNLEVSRRLKEQGHNLDTFENSAAGSNKNVSYGEVKNKASFEVTRTCDSQERSHIPLQYQTCAKDQITSSRFRDMNYDSHMERSRLTGKENLVQGTYPVSQPDFQIQQSMTSTQRKCCLAESTPETTQYVQPGQIQDMSFGKQPMTYSMYEQRYNDVRTFGGKRQHVQSGKPVERVQLGRQVHFDGGFQENGLEHVRKPSQGQRSFAGDLALVTQNILQNAKSSELPRKISLGWPPHRRVSIGLAPPRPREESMKTDHNRLQQQQSESLQTFPDKTPRSNRQRSNNNRQSCYNRQMSGRRGNYEQPAYRTSQYDDQSSLWSSYDSPPMDLDAPPDEGCNHSSKVYNTTNQQSKQGPTKQSVTGKRLSYRCVPGSKGGQTKLVFKGK